MMSPHELNQLADAIADRLSSRMASRPDDALIDVHAAAELLACSVPTIERLTKSGAIESVKIGRLRRYSRAALLSRRNEKGDANHGE